MWLGKIPKELRLHFPWMLYNIHLNAILDRKWKSLSLVWLSDTPWTIQSIEFSRPAYWDGWLVPSPGYLPNPMIKSKSSALQADSLPSEPPEKSKNTEVGSLSLLQCIFLTQEWNRVLLHCRWILNQLSYQSSRPLWTVHLHFYCLCIVQVIAISGKQVEWKGGFKNFMYYLERLYIC